MKIALYQQDIVWCDPEANYRKVETVLAGLSRCDLLVLPEMFTTGFVMEPDAVMMKPSPFSARLSPDECAASAGSAEMAKCGTEAAAEVDPLTAAEVRVPDNGQGPHCGLETPPAVEERLRTLSERYHCALAGSVAVQDGGRCFNRFYFMRPDGSFEYADKHHLFSYGGENLCYTPGQRRVVVNYLGVRFLILICYDLRFPVWSRCRDDYDILLCAANWPAVRQLSWNVLLRARAIENQCYAVGVNRVGEDKICPYAGGSTAVHPYGELLAECGTDQEGCAVFEPDMEMLRGYREKFPSLQDADRFQILK